MKKHDELRSTTSNKIYRRLRIPETSCGWCGLGSGCNKRNRRKQYSVRTTADDFEYDIHKGRSYPSWKTMSKYKKQYQKPKLKAKVSNNNSSWNLRNNVKYFYLVW